MEQQSSWWWPEEAAPGEREDTSPVASSPTAFVGLLAFTFILLISPQSIVPLLGHLRPAALAVGISMVAYCAARLRAGLPLLKRSTGLTTLACLVAWSVALVPLSVWPGGNVHFLVAIYLKSVVVFLMLVHIVDSVERLRKVAWLLSLLAIPLALVTVEHFFSNTMPASGPTAGQRVQGYDAPLTQNPNDMALMLNLILPLCLSNLAAAKRWSTRVFLVATIVLIILAIMLTFSRGGFLTLCFIGLMYFVTLGRAAIKYALPILVMIGAIVMPLVPSSYEARLDTITNISEDPTGSAQERYSDMFVAARVVAKHPVIGSGVGMNMLTMNKARGAHWIQVHNVYLQYAVDLGIPGLVLFVMLLQRAWSAAGAAGREPGELGLMAKGIRISIAAFAAAAMFYPDAYSFYFYYFAGLAFAARGVSSASGESREC